MTARAPVEHELKYVLPDHAARAAAILLRGVARPERPHATGTVESIYFDDHQLSSLDEKLASDYLKSKTRLRWYDGGGAVFLERKLRCGTRRSKRRVIVPLSALELSRDGLAALRGVSLTRWSGELGVALSAELAPVLQLRYRRERFVAPGGARLCLDSAIVAVAAAPGLASRRGPVRLGDAVFELKAAATALPPSAAPIAALGARRASFSKYAACLAALTA